MAIRFAPKEPAPTTKEAKVPAAPETAKAVPKTGSQPTPNVDADLFGSEPKAKPRKRKKP